MPSILYPLKLSLLFTIIILLSSPSSQAQYPVSLSNSFGNIVRTHNIYTNKLELLTTYNGEHYFIVEQFASGAPPTRSLYKTDGITYSQVALNVPVWELIGVFQNKLYIKSGTSNIPSYHIYSYDGTNTVAISNRVSLRGYAKFIQNELLFWGASTDTTNNTLQKGLMAYDGNTITGVDSFDIDNPSGLWTDTTHNKLYFYAKKAFYNTHYMGAYQNGNIIHLDSSSYASYDHQVYDNNLYFTSATPSSNSNTLLHQYNGNNLWNSIPINNGLGVSPSYLIQKKESIYFLARSSTNSSYYYTYKYANNQVTLFDETPKTLTGTNRESWLQVYDNQFFFSGLDTNTNRKNLYKKDTTLATTIVPTGSIMEPNSFFVYHNRLYFLGDSSNNNNLWWEYDQNTFRNILKSSTLKITFPHHFQIINGEMYFTAVGIVTSSSGFRELYKLSTIPHTVNITKLAPIQDLKVFPNPTTGQITLQTTAKIKTVHVLNIEGKVVLTPSVDNINISSLPIGIYILYAQTSEGSMYQKIIKE